MFITFAPFILLFFAGFACYGIWLLLQGSGHAVGARLPSKSTNPDDQYPFLIGAPRAVWMRRDEVMWRVSISLGIIALLEFYVQMVSMWGDMLAGPWGISAGYGPENALWVIVIMFAVPAVGGLAAGVLSRKTRGDAA
jgi:hypothetical protein